jgi:hypothetical protein
MTEDCTVSDTGGLSLFGFRQTFTVFGDTQKYTDMMISPWLTLAETLFDVNIWRGLRPYAIALFAAHNLILAKRDELADAAGGLPGQSGSGITASKSVGGASISYDTSSGLEQGAGYYNLTTYGTRLYRLIRLAGMGGTQLGGCPPNRGPFSGPAWPGVVYPS